MDPGLAHAPHAQQHDLQPGRLRGIGPTDIAAAVAVDNGGGLFSPVPGQRLDGPFLDPALLAGPCGSLGNAVLPSQHIVLEFVKSVGVLCDVFLVVGVLGDPHIGNGQLQGRIGVGQDWDPLVRMDSCAIVEIRADIYALESDVRQPVAEPRGHMAHHAQRRRLRVTAPEQQQIRMLCNIRIEVRLRRHLTHGLAAPDVLRPPEPAFPRVHVPHLEGIAAHKAQ